MAEDAPEVAPSELSVEEITKLEEAERERRVLEGQHVNEALLAVQEALVRLKAARTAHEGMDEEQARRVAEGNKLEVQQQLVRTSSQKKADQAMAEEQERRIKEGLAPDDDVKGLLSEVRGEIIKTFESPRYLKSAQETKTLVNEQLLSAIARKGVAAAVAEEHSRRVTDSPERSESVTAKVGEVMEELQTKAAVAEVKKLEELERERRILEEKMREIQDNLKRVVLAKEVKKEEELERERRILEENMRGIQEDLKRVVAGKEVLVQEEAERERRLAETKAVDEEVAKALSTLHTDLIRFVGVRDAKAGADLEKVQRIVTEQKKDVHVELVRKSSQLKVIQEEEDERARRIAESAMKEVLGEIRTEKTDAEKKHDEIENAMADVLTSVVRYDATRRARALAQEERTRRLAEQAKEANQDQMMSVVHRKQAAAAEEVARQEKIDTAIPDEVKAKQAEITAAIAK
jgi:uncharacterized protein (UPF0212 family)